MKYEPKAHGANCDACPLKGSRVVPPRSSTGLHLRMVCIGEGPSRADEERGEAFAGQPGRLFDASLQRIGVRRHEAHLTLAHLCRAESDSDAKRATECCAPRLLSELQPISRETPIATFGAAPLGPLLGVRKLLAVRGFVCTAPEIASARVESAWKTATRALAKGQTKAPQLQQHAVLLEGRAALAGRTVLPLLHPRFVLGADVWNGIWEADMARVGRVLRGEAVVDRNEASFLVGGPELLEGMGSTVVVDVETNDFQGRLGVMACSLTCVGVSDGERHVVMYPWRQEWAPALEAWLFTRERIVCHNASYDVLVLRRHGVNLEVDNGS